MPSVRESVTSCPGCGGSAVRGLGVLGIRLASRRALNYLEVVNKEVFKKAVLLNLRASIYKSLPARTAVHEPGIARIFS